MGSAFVAGDHQEQAAIHIQIVLLAPQGESTSGKAVDGLPGIGYDEEEHRVGAVPAIVAHVEAIQFVAQGEGSIGIQRAGLVHDRPG